MEESTRKVISFVKLREFMRNPSLSFGEKCVFIDLILYAGVDGEAFPSQETLAEDMGRTSRHIRNILKSLKSKNWIDWEKQGYSQSNRYYINEELYFLNDVNDRKSTSSDSGTAFPLQTRTPFPANEYQERNQLKESYKVRRDHYLLLGNPSNEFL